MPVESVFFSCKDNQQASKQQEQKGDQPMAIKVSSPAFEEGGMIPAKYTADGRDISPPLKFDNVPQEAKSLALISDDPDAPVGTWLHWLVWNIPVGISELAEAMAPNGQLSDGTRQGTTDFGRTGYGGPAPPSGTHRYYFKVYALDCLLELKPGATRSELEKAMKGHILAQGQLMGKYQRRR